MVRLNRLVHHLVFTLGFSSSVKFSSLSLIGTVSVITDDDDFLRHRHSLPNLIDEK